MNKKILIICIVTLLHGCSKKYPDIYLSCSGNSKSTVTLLGNVSEISEPKITSFSARIYPGDKHPIKGMTPYHVSIDKFSLEVNSVETSDFFITGKYAKRTEQPREEEEKFHFELNRKTGVLRYTSEIALSPSNKKYGITTTRIFEGNCTKPNGNI